MRYIYLAYVFATTANIYCGCSPRCLVTAGPSLDVKGTACFPPAVLPLSRPAAPSPQQISLHCPLYIVSSFIFLMGGRGEDFLAVFQYIVLSLLDNCVNEFKTNCQFQPRRTSPMCSFTRSQFRRMTSSTTASSGENTQYCSR